MEGPAQLGLAKPLIVGARTRSAVSESQTAVTDVSPPSTVRWAPVMNDASSESRNRMGLAISSGLEIR